MTYLLGSGHETHIYDDEGTDRECEEHPLHSVEQGGLPRLWPVSVVVILNVVVELRRALGGERERREDRTQVNADYSRQLVRESYVQDES